MSKKIVAMLMAVAMAFSLLPVTALAGNTSLLSITPPNQGTFATYKFYTSEEEQSPYYTQTVKTGDTLKPPADPTLAGSHFTGWKTADGKEVPFGTVTVEKASTIQCYAQWEENKNPIHVYFMAAKGSNEVMHTGVAKNGTVAIPEDYQDITWKTENDETFDETTVTKDMNVYPASESCWLTFDSQGGSAIASHYVRQGNDFDLSKVSKPTKAGYTFAGWSLTTNGASVTQVTPTKDTKLYALWTPTTADYTVIHWQENANDNEYSYITSEKKSGTTGTRTNATSKQYDGFTAKTITQKNINGDGSTIVNVYYQRNSYTIHFYYREIGRWEEYTGIQITAKHGADISSQWPEKKGSKTWSTNDDYQFFNGGLQGPYQVNIETMPLGGAKYYGPKTGRGSESAHYYVQVLPGESGTVTQGGVTYKLHHTDTCPGSSLSVTDEDKYPLTGFTYKEGTDNGANYNNAKFYYTRNSYDVVYVSGAEVKKEPYKYEQDISGAGNYKPDNAPDGYEFGGWYSDPSGTTQYNFSDKTMPAQNITVYANWVPITLTLTIEGVEGVTSGAVNYNQAINKANIYSQATTILENAGETVLYWVTSTGERVDVNSQMTKNLTIRPVLKGDTYTVTYTGGATNSDTHLYWYNTKSKVQEYTGEKSNKFLCWVDGNNQKYHPGDEILMTANVTLTAQFSGNNLSPTKYTVTYHSNFGTDQTYPGDSIENYKQFFTKTYTETRLPSQNGYDFTGWNTQSDGGGTSFAAGGPAFMNGPDNNHLYAQWSQKAPTYTLTYNANGGHFASEATTTTKEEMIAATGDHDLNYTDEYTPTHAQTSEGKNVIFLGWSTTQQNKVLSKSNVSDATTIASSITTKVDIPNVQTVYAVWSLDENGNNFPDVFEATVTYKIEHGYWFDSGTNGPVSTDPVTAPFTLYEKSGNQWVAQNPTLGNTIPTGQGGDAGYTADGWYRDSETTATSIDAQTPVTGDVTYTFKYVKTSTEVTWDVSRSKTATNLDGNYESKVTLSLPSAEEKLDSDIVFVVDKSESSEKESALSMLDAIRNQIDEGTKVNVGVVTFNTVATQNGFFDLNADYKAIKEKFDAPAISGTNLHAGILAGVDMLNKSSTNNNRKYLIVISDGITYTYDKDAKIVPYYWLNDGQPYFSKDPYSWDFKYGAGTTFTTDQWNTWRSKVENILKRETISSVLYSERETLTKENGVLAPQEGNYTSSVDRALYYSYLAYQSASEKYHCYAIPAHTSKESTYPYGVSFMKYLGGNKEASFNEIKNDILYLIDTGSYVEDYMGYVDGNYNFNFINDASKLTITVGRGDAQKKLDAVKIDDNHYGFGPVTVETDSSDKVTTYRYNLEYIPGNMTDTEHFVWRINVPVENLAPVALTYSVKLTNPKTAAGTYGVTDLNGDTFIDGTQTKVDTGKALYTNQSATLLPVNSAGKPGQPLLFPKPSVSYTVSSGNSGSHSGGSRPSLNTKDHYGYIIGYPVDYYTGQPTTDQTKKPVRPEGKITRAEVATIYFRMLTDESRTKFWSQSSGYSDVKTGDWFNNAVSTLSKAGIIAGYEDGSFRPNGYITRAEFATIAARFFDVSYNGKDLFPDISGHWAKDYINQAANKGFVNGYEDGTFKPDRNITRAEAVTLVNRTLDRHPDKNHFTKDMLVWPDNMDQTKWYYADMQEATNSHTYQMKENSDKTKYENWTKTLPIRNWEALEKAWSNANSSQGNGNVV